MGFGPDVERRRQDGGGGRQAVDLAWLELGL